MLAKRNLIGVMRNPEALLDVTLQPIIFIALFTYIFGGAIADGSQHDYLQFLLPGILAQTIAFGGVAIGVNLNTDIEKGVFDRFRSAADRARRAARRRRARRRRALRAAVRGDARLRLRARLPRRRPSAARGARRLRCSRSRFALCLCWVSVFIGMIARTPGAVQGILFLIAVPADVRRPARSSRSTRCRTGCRRFTEVNPMTHLVGALRGLMLGGPWPQHLLWTFGWMGALLAVFVPLALRAYGRRA